MSASDNARRALGVIRIVNGTVALVAPKRLARRLGADATSDEILPYVFRMFGVRTVLIGRDLLRDEPTAVRSAPLVHASDMVAAVLATASGRLPRRTGAAIVAISAANTGLALIARGSSR
jgi:uncharacterized protein YjeT (DUF2065 family)